MGRGHLSLLAAVFLVLAGAASVAAAGTIPWRVAARGTATGVSPRAPLAILATSRVAARRIAADVPADAARVALGVDYRTSLLLGVFGPFGCKDGRVRVTGVVERGRTLVVHLLVRPLPPGAAECLAIFPTFRLLVVPRSAPARLPTTAAVTVAGA